MTAVTITEVMVEVQAEAVDEVAAAAVVVVVEEAKVEVLAEADEDEEINNIAILAPTHQNTVTPMARVDMPVGHVTILKRDISGRPHLKTK